MTDRVAGSIGLRERKKQACRRALAAAARSLAVERGIAGFTIDDVAERADVSARTFFNYFESKEAAIIGVDDEGVRDLGERLAQRPAAEGPLAALRNTMLTPADDLSGLAHSWVSRLELVDRYPVLMPRHLAAIHHVEEQLVMSMAERLGRDPKTDPYPTVLVAAWIGTFRSTLAWWWNNGQPGVLSEHLGNALELLERGMTEPLPARSGSR